MNDQQRTPLQNVHEPRIKLVPFEQIKLGQKPRCLVQGLIPSVGLTIIYGPPKSGKSFWVFDLAMHIALGWEYRGRRVQQGPVVYAAFEGQSGIEARCEAFRLRFMSEQADGPPFYLEPLQLNLVRDVKELIAAIRVAMPLAAPAAIVLDTLNRSLWGSESSDEDMSAYVRAIDALREEFDCAVLVVHHSGVEATRPRGHSSLTGAAEAQLAVKRDAAGDILVTVEAMKDGPDGDTIASCLEVVEVGYDTDGNPITSCVVLPTSVTAQKDKVPVRGAAKIALDILRRAICDSGEQPPASNHIPPDIQAVRVELWRHYCYEGAITGSDSLDARQKAFARASQKLQSIGAIGKWGEWVWPT